MRICILDGETILDKDMLHDTLAAALDFPDWYGRNLDGDPVSERTGIGGASGKLCRGH